MVEEEEDGGGFRKGVMLKCCNGIQLRGRGDSG